MNLQELLGLCYSSNQSDWTRIDVHRDPAAQGHHSAASYAPDLRIGWIWGAQIHDNFSEPWSERFPDPRAWSSYWDFTFCGQVVHQEVYVSVDGARAMLPLPKLAGDLENPVYQVTQFQVDLFRLFNSIQINTPFDSFIRTAGFEIIAS